jgi:hypothetical protein
LWTCWLHKRAGCWSPAPERLIPHRSDKGNRKGKDEKKTECRRLKARRCKKRIKKRKKKEILIVFGAADRVSVGIYIQCEDREKGGCEGGEKGLSMYVEEG